MRGAGGEVRAPSMSVSSEVWCFSVEKENILDDKIQESRQARRYPRTLILENDGTARPEVERPIDIAGRNVVKISIRFTCGRSSSESFESERMR